MLFTENVGELGRVLLIVSGMALASGCVENAFTPATTLRLAARPERCYLDLIFRGEPPFPYVVIGRISTESTAPGMFAIGENNAAAMQRLKEEACRQGAHGLLQASSEANGTWNNDGYSKSTNGAAIAFVYVDPNGQVLPPPAAGRLLIHPGAASAPPPGPPPASLRRDAPWRAPPYPPYPPYPPAVPASAPVAPLSAPPVLPASAPPVTPVSAPPAVAPQSE